jgi:hypothetical protein
VSGLGVSASPGKAVGPGISVREALRHEPRGPILVRGHLVVGPNRTRLCDRLAPERADPCAGASVRVRGLPRDERRRIAPHAGANGTTWSDDVVTVLGRLRDHVLAASRRSTA